MEMYNSHIHTFRDIDVPEKFLPLGLVRWIAKKDHKALFWILKKLNPFSDDDIIDKYIKFITTGKKKSQKEILSHVQEFYPSGTKFVILPMDMAYMGAGKVPRDYKDQLDELFLLSDDTAIKFIHIDPRRPEVKQLFTRYIARGFKGVKLYPPLGYFPNNPVLMDIYEACDKFKLPVIAHGSPANPVHYRGPRKELFKLLGLSPDNPFYKHKSNKELCSIFTHPLNYKPILTKFQCMNVCIAHMGSIYWDEYISGEFSHDNWLTHIIDMIHQYDNFWTDVSYTLVNPKYWALFKVMLSSDDKLSSRVLFGSDYYMNEVEDNERKWSIDFRCFIGEELFRKIAVDNPKKFLNL